MENIIENNKLIAEFMGYGTMFRGSEGWETAKFNFHNSWDSLMPVLRRIKNFIIENDLEEWDNSFDNSLVSIDINNIYKTIIEFIKWHNENK